MNVLEPIDFKESNRVYKGDGMQDVADLRVYEGIDCLLSCWKAGWYERLKILITGKVWLCVKGKWHPAVWIGTEGFEKNKGGNT